MKIFSNLSEVLLDIDVDDNSYRYRSIMGDHKVVLHFSMAESIEIPVGSYIQYQGQTYTLFRPENFKKNGTRKFEYEITFGSSQELLKQFKFKFLATAPYKLKFPLTAKPKMFLDLLVQNLNLNDQGWSVGSFIDATERALSFNHDDCFSVLGRLADEFDTEWEIVGKTIHLRKVEHNKETPLPLSYGKGNGFKTGVGRTMQGDKRPVTMLYVQGGDRNIDRKNYYSPSYKSETLLLPMDQTFSYEGRTYKTDTYGMYITRADKPLTVVSEDSYDGSAFYPSRVGEVTAVETKQGTDDEGNAVTFYDIIDSTIPNDLDFSKCTIKEEKVTIIFQSGKLTGKEFDIVTDDKGALTGYVHAERRFKLVPANMDGVTMPNANWCPSIGDKYAVFHIALPDPYIRHDATQTGASWDMFKEAVRYMYENEEEKFSFTGELDGIWSKKNWLSVGGKLIPGSYILFSDPQFQPQGIPIRITGITDYINKPYSPTIELSNAPVAGYLSTELNKIKGEEVVNEGMFNSAIQYTKRTWRDVKETMDMMFDPEGDYFTELIKPLVVHTAQLIVGTNSQQMDFVGVKFIPNADNNPNLFKNTAGRLEHFTIDPRGTVKQWTIGASSHTLLNNYPYYVYVKCLKSGNTGQIVVSTEKIKLEDVSGYYHFWVGVLNTPIDGVRSWQPNYGYTEIAGQQITTGVIKDRLARLVIDLINGTIYGKVTFAPGSTGYDNLEDRPNLTAMSNTITKDANTNATNFVNTAKNDMAKKLGYTGWNHMAVTAAIEGKTLIDGGFINTSLIQAEDIVTKALVASRIDSEMIASKFIETDKLWIKDNAKIGKFTVFQDFLKYEAGNNQIYIGDGIYPSSSGFNGMIKLVDANTNRSRKAILYIDSTPPSFEEPGTPVQNIGLYINSGALKMNPGNIVDIPGPLLGGRVTGNALSTNQWGRGGRGGLGRKESFKVSKDDSLLYKITHNLGHENYMPVITPWRPGSTWNKLHPIIFDIKSDYFTLAFIDSIKENSRVESGFCFVVMGNNTSF